MQLRNALPSAILLEDNGNQQLSGARRCFDGNGKKEAIQKFILDRRHEEGFGGSQLFPGRILEICGG